MKSLISQIIVVLFLSISISAQENQPELVDEFGKIHSDELMFRIDGFARHIYKIPNSKALVRISGGNKDYFGLPYVRGSIIKSGWEYNVKQPAEKLLIQFCNVNEGPLHTQFFIVRENDKVETCNENLIIPKQTVLFDDSHFYVDFETPEFAFDSIENRYVAWESVNPAQYSEFALNILKKMLKDSPENKVYIIAYLQTNFEEDENGKTVVGKPSNLDKKYYAQKMFRVVRKKLIKNGFSNSQIKTLDGGYVNGNGRRLEFWFVPQGGEIPKPKPEYLPKKK